MLTFLQPTHYPPQHVWHTERDNCCADELHHKTGGKHPQKGDAFHFPKRQTVHSSGDRRHKGTGTGEGYNQKSLNSRKGGGVKQRFDNGKHCQLDHSIAQNFGGKGRKCHNNQVKK